MALPEVNQAVGAGSTLLYNKETSWGTLRTSGPAWKTLRQVGGESLDSNIAIYSSDEIRSDRFENQDVLGTEDPGGQIPCELSPSWGWLLYHTFGTVQASTAGPVNAVQTVTLTLNGNTGNFTLIYKTKETTNLASTAIGATVQSALEALSTIGTGNVTVSGGAGGPYVITAAGTLAGTNMELLEGNNAGLTGGSTAATISCIMTTRGVASGSTKHLLYSGANTMPQGFTLEKGFIGLDSGSKGYHTWLGCRSDSLAVDMNINAFMRGTFDILARQMLDPVAATVSSSVAAAGVEDPFTSKQIAVLEGSTLTHLGIARSASLHITNSYNRDGYVLGKAQRVNAKPQKNMVTGNLEVMFKNSTLYDKAIARTDTRLLFSATSGNYSLDFHVLSARINPNGSVPKVTDGPLYTPFSFKATKPAANVSVEGVNFGVTVPTVCVAVLVGPDSDLTV